jgi:hypothetical protein
MPLPEREFRQRQKLERETYPDSAAGVGPETERAVFF